MRIVTLMSYCVSYLRMCGGKGMLHSEKRRQRCPFLPH